MARKQQFSEAMLDLGGFIPPGGAEPAEPPGHLGHRARMRTKLLGAGPEALLDHELLEMMLFTAMPRRDTKPIARALLARFGGFAEALAAPAAELTEVEGMGEAGAAALKTVQAAALRMMRAELRDRPLLNNWDRLVGYLTASLAREKVEQFRVLFLDTPQPPDRRRGAGARHGEPHAGLSPRGGAPRARAPGHRADPRPQPPERRPDPEPRRHRDDARGEIRRRHPRHHPARPPHHRPRRADLLPPRRAAVRCGQPRNEAVRPHAD
jgi:hypothetical protein